MPAVSRQSDAGDKAHGNTVCPRSVIPGRSEATSPESTTTIVSMDSGPAPSGASRNDELEILASISIRLRQAQHFLGNEAENELRADRGDAGNQGLAQIALDMKLLGIAEAAMGHHRLLAGVIAGFSGEIFRGMGRRAAGQALTAFPNRRQR